MGYKGYSQNIHSVEAGPNALKIQLDTEKTYQTIHNFGASDAWATQFVGKWPNKTKEKIATLLFSTLNKKDGSPEGIGLSAWRFNIGAGSSEQGEASKIIHEWRRAECFLNKDGTYNWDKQVGQLWFLEEAKKKGVSTFIGFVNSPPVYFTKNGKAYSNDGISSNLKEEYYNAYADFLSTVTLGVADKTGVMFDYISPFNEPQWEWKCCKQEGTPWNNDEMYKIIKKMDASFAKYKVPSKLEITEAASIGFLYESTYNEKRQNQIQYFFDPTSPTFVGDLKSVARKVAGHSYFSTWDLDKLINSRKQLDKKIDSIDSSIEYWMSEYCILEDNEEIKGKGQDLSIAPALYMAKVIHSDLVFANASAWHWWLAVSPYDFKDGLVYVDENKYGGNYLDSKMLWALGNYSRFIRPGMKRIHLSRSDDKSLEETIKGVLPSAYMSNDKIVVVLVNQLNTSKEIALSGIPNGFHEMEVYQTSETLDLKKTAILHVDDKIIIPTKSITTCVLTKNDK
ncbi:glycoside hydrolase [Flagellimonas amphidinii]|uniref:glycoside hydrolase n=1 Tax=Flagellimonas amphidinii TaxID=2735167 RepID=UPI00149137C4|nr:glycoside hydrolase [Allomuricauda amphidinii]